MKFDLHLHSSASDGCLGFGDILSLAKDAGLDGLALTDHDWTGHLDEAALLAAGAGMRFVGGVEISAMDPTSGRPVHILGYHLGSESPSVTALCKPVLAARHRTVLDTLDWLAGHGLHVDLEEVEEVAWGSHGGVPGATGDGDGAGLTGGSGQSVLSGQRLLDRSPVLYRQHVMEALRRRGLPLAALKDLEKKFRLPGGPWTGPRNYPMAHDALAAVKADGGLAVLAHPGLDAIWDLVPALVAEGLEGLELDHPAHSPADRQLARELCSRYRLFPTGGSDFHGEYARVHADAAGMARAAGAATNPDAALEGKQGTGTSGVSDVHGNGAFPGAGLCPPSSVVYFGHERARELRFAEKLLRQAGDWLRKERENAALHDPAGLEVVHKEGDHRDLVSRCDHEVDARVREAVESSWPGHLILTEEGETPVLIGEGPLWILDPVDGTTNFLRSGRDWSVSLALWEGGKPCFGLVLEGQPDLLHVGVPGLGYWNEGRRIDTPGQRDEAGQTQRFSQTGSHAGSGTFMGSSDSGLAGTANPDLSVLAGTVLDASLNTLTDLARRGVDLDGLNRLICGHRSCGCASLALVRMAQGRLDAFVSAKLRVWDWAAGVIMLQESGGYWSGLHGQVPDSRDPAKCPFIAGRTRETVLALKHLLDRPTGMEVCTSGNMDSRQAGNMDSRLVCH